MSSTGCPRARSRTGGTRTPSWKQSRAAGAKLPGTMPPMSTMCPDALAQPMRVRPRKIGRMTTTSCKWRPPPSCGSLARKTSPGAIALPKRARTAAIDPAHTPK